MISRHQVVNTFAGDSLALKVAIFDMDGRAFNPEPYGISTATLSVAGSEVVTVAYSEGNVINFYVPRGKLNVPGSLEFHVQIAGDEHEARFTLVTGRIVVLALPKVD